MKNIFILTISILLYFSSFSQVTLELYDENDVNVTNTTRHLEAEISYHLKVKNTGSSDITVIFELSEIDVPHNALGIEVCFFGTCTAPTTTTGQVGASHVIAAGETYYDGTNDHITYQNNGETGPANFQITIKEETNPTNAVTYSFDTETLINEIDNSSIFSIFPNPAKDFITFEVDEGLKGSQIIITNLLGKIVSKNNVISQKQTVNTSRLKSGVYFVSVIKNKRIIETKKLIIK